MDIRPVDINITNFIRDRDLVCLRSKKTGNALGVSYTEEGLKWCTSASGRLIYYKNAKISKSIDLKRSIFEGKDYITGCSIISNNDRQLERSDEVYVEKFIPTNRPNLRSQLAEYSAIDRAYRMLYSSYFNTLPSRGG